MKALFLTADKIATQTGGGIVTRHESDALRGLDPHCVVWDRDFLHRGSDPWGWDQVACKRLRESPEILDVTDVCHIYSGCFSDTVRLLKSRGVRVTYTVAAHDRKVSQREHEALGLEFPYPHLVEPMLWDRYIEGYRLADVIITPGSVPRNTIWGYDHQFESKPIDIIPHGCDLPELPIVPLPERFTVGYLGAYGPDKGVRYLLEAWKSLNYTEAILLLGGKESLSPWVTHLVSTYGGGNIIRTGWVENVSSFYSQCSLYIQPSATEGFGCEILEAMAHGRPVLCSDGAGACDLVPEASRFRACDSKDLAERIYLTKECMDYIGMDLAAWRSAALPFTWDSIEKRYQQVWTSLL